MRWTVAAALVGVLLTALGGRPSWTAPSMAVLPVSARTAAPIPPAVDTVFRHAAHTDVACTRCHSSGAGHGELLVRTRADCRSCHHALPVAAECTSCHEDDAGSERLLEVVTTLTLPQSATATRPLPFRHALHQAVACTSCHGAPPEVRREGVDCAACHADHHRPSAQCSACHAAAPAAAHPLAVHAGCSGAGCHVDSALPAMPRARPACLVCHQDRVDHRPGGECVDCHVLPPATPAALGIAAHGAGRDGSRRRSISPAEVRRRASGGRGS